VIRWDGDEKRGRKGNVKMESTTKKTVRRRKKGKKTRMGGRRQQKNTIRTRKTKMGGKESGERWEREGGNQQAKESDK